MLTKFHIRIQGLHFKTVRSFQVADPRSFELKQPGQSLTDVLLSRV